MYETEIAPRSQAIRAATSHRIARRAPQWRTATRWYDGMVALLVVFAIAHSIFKHGEIAM